MTDSGISDRVTAFLANQIDSLVQLEALLLLHANPGKNFTPADITRELRIDAEWAEPNLNTLCDRHVVTCVKTPDTNFTYAPQSPELAATIDELAECYSSRRVSVISTIFSKPRTPLQHFADAFRFRKDKTDG